MDPIDKIQLDDITFDDVIGGDGVSITPEDTIDPITDTVTDDKPEDTLDDKPEVDDEKPEVEEKVDPTDDKPEDDQDDQDDPEAPEGEDTVVSEVLEKLGYEVENSYADTAEGLAEMTKDVASQMADDRIDEVLENFPMVKQHLEYVLAGGESNNFMQAYDPRSDYNQVSLTEDDSRSQKAILSDYFNMKGHDKEFIDEILEDYEDSGKLYNKAEAARQALGKQQSAQKAQMVEKQRGEWAEQERQQTEFWNGVSDTIENSKEFAGLVVPEREKSKFFKYISTPVNKSGSQTQRDLDHSEAEMEVEISYRLLNV